MLFFLGGGMRHFFVHMLLSWALQAEREKAEQVMRMYQQRLNAVSTIEERLQIESAMKKLKFDFEQQVANVKHMMAQLQVPFLLCKASSAFQKQSEHHRYLSHIIRIFRTSSASFTHRRRPSHIVGIFHTSSASFTHHQHIISIFRTSSVSFTHHQHLSHITGIFHLSSASFAHHRHLQHVEQQCVTTQPRLSLHTPPSPRSPLLVVNAPGSTSECHDIEQCVAWFPNPVARQRVEMGTLPPYEMCYYMHNTVQPCVSPNADMLPT